MDALYIAEEKKVKRERRLAEEANSVALMRNLGLAGGAKVASCALCKHTIQLSSVTGWHYCATCKHYWCQKHGGVMRYKPASRATCALEKCNTLAEQHLPTRSERLCFECRSVVDDRVDALIKRMEEQDHSAETPKKKCRVDAEVC